VTADDGVSKFGKKGVYLCQYDDSGKLIDVLELEAVVDSFWDENPTIAAIASEGGRTVFNKAMAERGIIDTATSLSGNIAALTTLKNLMSLLYMGYMSQNNKPIYSLYKDGERYMYSNKVEFEMAVAEAKAARLEEERRNIAVRHQKRGRAEHGPLEARRSRRVGV